MCVVSSVMDDFIKRYPSPFNSFEWDKINRQEFNLLVERVQKLEEELKIAKQQDIKEGNSDCENEQKKEIIKKIAENLGIEIEFPE